MAQFDGLYKVQKKDLRQVVDVLTDAFSDDSMWQEVFKDKSKNCALTEVMVRFCLKYGNVISTSDNLEGIMALAPHDKEMTLWRIIRSGAFFLSLKIVDLWTPAIWAPLYIDIMPNCGTTRKICQDLPCVTIVTK